MLGVADARLQLRIEPRKIRRMLDELDRAAERAGTVQSSLRSS